MRLRFAWLAALSVLMLTACNTPDRPFRGLTPTRVEVEGSVFDIRVRGEFAEAIRVNPQYAPRFEPVRSRAAVAFAQVSGCRVVGVLGDQSQMTANLDCSDGSKRKLLPP